MDDGDDHPRRRSALRGDPPQRAVDVEARETGTKLGTFVFPTAGDPRDDRSVIDYALNEAIRSQLGGLILRSDIGPNAEEMSRASLELFAREVAPRLREAAAA